MTAPPDSRRDARVHVSAGTPEPDAHPARWRMLALLAAAELLGMSLWFSASAVSPHFARLWHLGGGETAWLTNAVQLGFVAGTAVAALLNLPDIIPAHRLFSGAALLGAIANAALLTAGGYHIALGWRFLTGFALAGVYPPAMKMAATWFRSGRGLAIGTVVGALTVGKATPYLVHAFPGAGARTILLTASASAAVGALIVFTGYRDGPYPFPPRPFTWHLAGEVVHSRPWRLVMGGYLGHMFELYSFWTWIPVFLAASIAAHAHPSSGHDAEIASVLAFLTIAVGSAGCLWGGWIADRRGREWLVTVAMAASGTCALVIGLLFGASLLVLAPVALTWGFFVIADSAQFSTLVTESVAPHAVGTALTLQTSLGFLLTTVSIQLIPPVAEALGWRYAFPVLALGPAFGIAAIRRLRAYGRAGRPTP